MNDIFGKYFEETKCDAHINELDPTKKLNQSDIL